MYTCHVKITEFITIFLVALQDELFRDDSNIEKKFRYSVKYFTHQ